MPHRYTRRTALRLAATSGIAVAGTLSSNAYAQATDSRSSGQRYLVAHASVVETDAPTLTVRLEDTGEVLECVSESTGVTLAQETISPLSDSGLAPGDLVAVSGEASQRSCRVRSVERIYDGAKGSYDPRDGLLHLRDQGVGDVTLRVAQDARPTILPYYDRPVRCDVLYTRNRITNVLSLGIMNLRG